MDFAKLMEILKMLSGPLIGAVIGYFTNMIAVKMLFYPKREIRLLGRRLPLTPGVIPKGRPRLARSIGEVIETHLLTKEDITGHLLSEKVEQKAADAVMTCLAGNIGEEITAFSGWDVTEYEQKKAAFSQALSAQIVRALQSTNAVQTIVDSLAETLREKYSATPLKLLVNERTLKAVMQPTGDMLHTMIDEHGAETIAPILSEKLNEADSQSGLALLARFDVDEPTVRKAVIDVYRKIVDQCAEGILSSVHLSSLAEEKINAMPIDELERLVQEVMKKELNAIVNLGALIGFILGLFNLLLR